MGDIAMTVPVVYSLAKQYPQTRITVLSRPFAKAFFENIAPNVGFMQADLKNEYKGVKGLNKLYRRLSAKQFTAIADLHDVIRTKYLRMRFLLSGCKTAHIDKHRQLRKKLVSSSNRMLVQLPTSFHNYAAVFEKLGFHVQIDFKSIFPKRGNLALLPSIFADNKRTHPWIGIAPFAAHPQKTYPTRHTSRVVDALIKKHPNCRIFLFGRGPREEPFMRQLPMLHTQCIEASPQLKSLKEELILMSHLDVMISMDSANMHLASLTATPVVSIWGGTHPFAGFLGWGQSILNVVQIDLPCRPCSIFGNKPCMRGDMACMKNISPEMVIKKVETILNSKENKA